MNVRALPAPVAPFFDVPIRPAAVAHVWTGAGNKYESIAVPGVALAAGEVLVEIELSTVCASDVHTVLGDRAGVAPSVLGHEYVGRVMALGSDRIRCTDGAPLMIGDRVVWSVFAACAVCDRCRRGFGHSCREVRKYGHERIMPRWELSGGYATHAHLRAGTAITRVPAHLDASVVAPAACATATAHAAVTAATGVVDADNAVAIVSGAGLVGLTVTAMLADAGARVIVADARPARRLLAEHFGAMAVFDPTDGEALLRVLDQAHVIEPSIIIETSGARQAVVSAFANIGVGGVVVLAGAGRSPEAVSIDPDDFARRGITIRGVHDYGAHDLDRAVQFLKDRHRRYPFSRLVSAVFDLDDLALAVETAARGEAIRVGLQPRRG